MTRQRDIIDNSCEAAYQIGKAAGYAVAMDKVTAELKAAYAEVEGDMMGRHAVRLVANALGIKLF